MRPELLTWGSFKLRRGVSVKYTPDFKDSVTQNVNYLTDNFYIDCVLQ